MDWIRAHYDRAAVLAAAIFLVLCSFFIFLSAASFQERFSAIPSALAPNDKMLVSKAPEIEDALHRLQAPPQWTFSGRSSLFVPEKHFIGANGQPATLQNTLLHPPVPNEWLEEFSLPITEGDVLNQDPDDDGFSNLDEWEGHSNPIEKSSHPSYLSKLKLQSFTEEMFPLLFSSSVEETYAINSIDWTMPTQFLKLGEMVRGTRYKIAEYNEKYDKDKYGTTIDVSELTLEDVENHDRVTLVKEKPATSPESVAHFFYTWGGREQAFSVKKNEKFSLEPEQDVTYQLLDVHSDKAIIIDVQKPNEKIEIGPL